MSEVITIDKKEYKLEALPEDVRNSLQSMGFMDGKVTSLQMEIAYTKTAQSAYGSALSKNLPDETEKNEGILKINEKKYAIDEMSEDARKQASAYQYCSQQLDRLNVELTVAQTARNVYAKSVRDGLPE